MPTRARGADAAASVSPSEPPSDTRVIQLNVTFPGLSKSSQKCAGSPVGRSLQGTNGRAASGAVPASLPAPASGGGFGASAPNELHAAARAAGASTTRLFRITQA